MLACKFIPILLLMVAGCHQSLQKYEYNKPEMGTVFGIALYAPDGETANRAANAAFSRAEELNAVLSDYDPNSELSRLSRQTDSGPMTAPIAVGPDLSRILNAATDASRRSNGAFDITLGPCIKLWRRSHQMGQLPTPERIAEAKKSVGWQAIKLFPGTHSVQLLKPKMRLDVGGIAKGYTAQEMAATILKHGITRMMVGAAGDITVGDPPPGKKYWRIGVRSFERADQSVDYVNLRNASVSTSGDTERFVIIEGQRYSHIIDPHTCLGLTRRVGVTVIAPEGTSADWLCKPPCILGPEEGLRLIEETPGAAARIVTLDGDKPVIYESKRWVSFRSDATSP
jgi:thiamine biosynthesis lipoprotein